jgi:hypothetical protein
MKDDVIRKEKHVPGAHPFVFVSFQNLGHIPLQLNCGVTTYISGG